MNMELFSRSDRSFVETVSCLCFTNPFLPERVALERRALGSEHRDLGPVWSLKPGQTNSNVDALGRRTRKVVNAARERLASGFKPSHTDEALYRDLVSYYLFYLFEDDFLELARASLEAGLADRKVDMYGRYAAEAERLLGPLGDDFAWPGGAAHLFACQFQVRRAFLLVYENILGASAPSAGLRGAVWQSIFTHDMRRYHRALFDRMHEIPTLITGPSGTGKELVARAIGLSRYLPFDAKSGRFGGESGGAFFALNVSALAPTVVESELFGHKRGAFTGAIQDRVGWLEITATSGTVFLDEIGELDPSIQVKLLRVLQTRQFQRVGDTRTHSFAGKLVTATSRDLGEEMRQGRFREDFYYRLCADVIVTPSLRAQLADAPSDLAVLVSHALERMVDGDEVPDACRDVVEWIEANMGPDYPWPGNVRELEQCVRSVIVRGSYRPAAPAPFPSPSSPTSADAAGGDPALQDLFRDIGSCTLSAEQLLNAYCTIAYARLRSFQEASRRLGLDRRTVKSRIDPELLAALQAGTPGPGPKGSD